MPNSTEPERVRANTLAEVNWRIDQRIEENVRFYSGQAARGNCPERSIATEKTTDGRQLFIIDVQEHLSTR